MFATVGMLVSEQLGGWVCTVTQPRDRSNLYDT
jgi:hypothetical protein